MLEERAKHLDDKSSENPESIVQMLRPYTLIVHHLLLIPYYLLLVTS